MFSVFTLSLNTSTVHDAMCKKNVDRITRRDAATQSATRVRSPVRRCRMPFVRPARAASFDIEIYGRSWIVSCLERLTRTGTRRERTTRARQDVLHGSLITHRLALQKSVWQYICASWASIFQQQQQADAAARIGSCGTGPLLRSGRGVSLYICGPALRHVSLFVFCSRSTVTRTKYWMS